MKLTYLLIFLILMPLSYAQIPDISFPEPSPGVFSVPGYVSEGAVKVTRGSFLELVTESASPEPVDVGADLVAIFRLYNRGTENVKDIEIALEESYPFLLKDTTEKTTIIQELCAGCSASITYHLSVSPNAVTGTYPLKVVFYEKNSSRETERKIQVIGKPNLIISDISITNQILTPGSEFFLLMAISNVGKGSAKDTKVALQLDGIPVIPLKDNVFYIKSLAPGESSNASFNLVIDKNAEVKAYKLPIQISGSYEFGANNFLSEEIAGINILGNAELSIASISTDPAVVNENENFFLILRIENTGSGDASSIKLGISLPFEGPKEIFLSKIKSDSENSAIFSLNAKNDGNYNYVLKINYTDDIGEHSISYPLVLYVAPKLTTYEIIFYAIITTAALWFIIWIRFHKRISKYIKKIKEKHES